MNLPFASCEAFAAESGVVNTDRLNIRSGPGTGYAIVATLSAGTSLAIDSETTASDGYTWYAVSFSGGSGYARSDYVRKNTVYSTQSADFENYLSSEGFPESYKNGLRGLHEKYPNWVFEAEITGLSWSDVLEAETKLGKSLIASSSISSWKSLQTGAFDWAGNYWVGFDGSTWVQASDELVAYYLDPRNFLSDPYIFQFELQKYDPSLQTRDGLVSLVSGTFLAGDAIVPVAGSVIEGGTVIEGSTYSSGSAISTGSSQSSSANSSIGPGGSSSGSSVIIAPGVTLSSSAASTGMFDGITELIEKVSGSVTAYAANWQETESHWYYYLDDGSTLKDGWYWLDGNADGIAECYYFYSDGTMAESTITPDSYTVDSLGRWTEGGIVQTKPASEAYSVGSSSASASSSTPSSPASASASGGELKKVPYVDIIMYAASSSGVSPYVIASTILQEQGSGTSELVSGTNAAYPGYYNFFNTNAYEHDGMSAVTSGLQYAYEKGWDTIEKSIIGGAENYGLNYVSKGQDTFYLKKFNVQGSNLYNHQYMTHVLAAASEGAKVSAAYSDTFKQSQIVFKIPVYEGMPESTTLPTGDGSPNNKLSALSVEGMSITPTFNMDTTEYSLIVDGSSAYIDISAQKIDSRATVTGTGTVALSTGLNNITVSVTAENGDVRNYYLAVTRRDGGAAADSGTLIGPGTAVSIDSGQNEVSSEADGTVTIGAGPAG